MRSIGTTCASYVHYILYVTYTTDALYIILDLYYVRKLLTRGLAGILFWADNAEQERR